MVEGPLQHAFLSDSKDIVRKEIITYKIATDEEGNQYTIKEVVSRSYFKDGDYIDNVATYPLK